MFSENKIYLQRKGIIQDKEGFVNIRENPSKKSKVIKILKNNELIRFTPDESLWWKVETLDGSVKGYIYFDRIKQFGTYKKSMKSNP
jgi:hypothetical protein